MYQDPRHKYLTVKAAVDSAAPSPSDPLMASLYTLLSGGVCDDAEVTYAYDLYATPNHQAALDAFFLARMTLPEISNITEIPESVLATYAMLFMDLSVFRNRLEIVSYAGNYEGTDYGRELVRVAVTVGGEYLRWTFGKAGDQLDNRSVVRLTMVDTFFRGLAHKGNALTSDTAKEALKWWSVSIKNAETLEKIDPRTAKTAFEELRITLEQKDSTHTVESSPVKPADILH